MMQKRVRFGETSKRYLPDLGLTKTEHSLLWFSKEELKSFRQSSTFCTTAIVLYQHQVRKKYVHYVLQTQEASRKIGLDDATGLAALAAARSKTAVEKALIQGAKDAAKVADAAEATAHRNQKAALSASREVESDTLKKPSRCNGRRTQVAIKAPRRNRTVAHMA